MEAITVNPIKSYLEGHQVPIDEQYGGLGALFLETLSMNLNKINQIDTVTGVTETNGSVRSRAIQIAHELIHLGLVENDIILICSRCHTDQTVVVLACLLIGCIVAPIDSELHHDECVELLGQLKPKVCFCDLRTLKQLDRVIMEIRITSKMIHFGEQTQDAVSFKKLTLNRQYPEQFKPVTIDNPRKHCAFILPTQGVTGPPRLVCISHHFIYCQISVLLDIMDSPEKLMSYYSLSSILQIVLMCLGFKTPAVRILTGPFAQRNACKLIHDFKVDYAFMNTELALHFVEDGAIRDFNLAHLKCVFIGGLTTTSHDITRLVVRLPRCKFIQLYFTTEVGVVLASELDNYKECVEKQGTTGKVVQNCKARVVDIDTREDVEPEIRGELLIATNCMMLGYFKNMSYTKSCTQDGYFKTGDIARYDSCGWFFIEGRIVDLLKVKGFQESPRELEDTIMSHPYVKDVAVIGNDQEVVACVVPKSDTQHLDENKIMAFISNKLPVHKWPTRIVIMTDFPTTPLGKVKKDVLKNDVLSIKIERSQTMLAKGNNYFDDDEDNA